jgi:very-short-patch-repair endonuclease
MKFFDLDHKEHGKNINKYKRSANRISKSEKQNKLGQILETIFKNFPIYEELPCFGTRLKLDFYVHQLKLAFEFDDKQHEEFNPFFHGNKRNWIRSQQRDDEKEKWCKINGVVLIRIKEKDLDKAIIINKVNKAYEQNNPGIVSGNF